MTTTSPSWFPSWPASFPDIEDAYLRTVLRQFPPGLYEEGTDEYKDMQSTAVVLSWVAQGGEWIKRRVFPQNDAGAMALGLWEEATGIPRRATIALRQAAIIGWLRMMGGNASKSAVQAVMAPIFGVDDPSRIAFSWAEEADLQDVATSARAAALNLIHIYDSLETAVPDEQQAKDAIRLLKPTWQGWSFGRYKVAKYRSVGSVITATGRGYNRGCYQSL